MNPTGDQLGQQAASEPEVFLLYEGGEVAEALRSKLTHVRVGPQVTEIPDDTFRECKNLMMGCRSLVNEHFITAWRYEA